MTNPYEGGALERADIEIMFAKAEKVIAQSQIKEADFLEPQGPYSKGMVERDIQIVKKKQAEFKAKDENPEAKMLATIFEAIVLEHGEQSNWFGEFATTIKTSLYDDFENGVDAIVEFNQEGQNQASHLGLAADVTFIGDTTKKFNRLRGQIDSGKLTRVKYFHSESMSIHGQLSKVPEVIIGASRRMLMELAELWIERKNSELAEHRIQIMILHQIRAQLITFAKYAEKIGNNEVKHIYLDRLAIINQILESKKDLEKRCVHELMDDSVHANIMNCLVNFDKGSTQV